MWDVIDGWMAVVPLFTVFATEPAYYKFAHFKPKNFSKYENDTEEVQMEITGHMDGVVIHAQP